MVILFILGVILIIAGVVLQSVKYVEDIDYLGMPAILSLVLGVVLFVGGCSSTKVDSAEVGIKFNKLSLTEQGDLEATRCSGFIFYNPITTDVFTYPVKVMEKDYAAFTVNTKDAATFSMDPYLSYYIDKDMAVQIFKTYRDEISSIESGFMRTAIYDAFRIVSNKYTSDSLMAHRSQFENEVNFILDSVLAKEGFIVKQFTTQITPPASLAQMIEEKNRAVQESLKAENEVKKAEAESKIRIAKAKGEAEAMRIKADGEAYYNRTISASLSPMIVQEDWIEKWDGKLPTYQAGSNGMTMLNIGR